MTFNWITKKIVVIVRTLIAETKLNALVFVNHALMPIGMIIGRIAND